MQETVPQDYVNRRHYCKQDCNFSEQHGQTLVVMSIIFSAFPPNEQSGGPCADGLGMVLRVKDDNAGIIGHFMHAIMFISCHTDPHESHERYVASMHIKLQRLVPNSPHLM